MFRIGDKLAHPEQGACVIDSIEEMKIDGSIRMYYVLKVQAVDGMLIKIPTDKTEKIGVRPIVVSKQADELMACISDIDAEMTATWNKRHRDNMHKIKSGELLEVARVVKGLMLRDGERGLSTQDRKTLQDAKKILISEIGLSKNLTHEEVESLLNASLA